jgi:hypothetical protein
MTKLIISTLAAAIALSTVSTSFAAPKRPANEMRVPETGAESWQSRGNFEDAGYAYRR